MSQLKKLILKKKGSVKLAVRDIFNSQNFSGSINYQDIDAYIKNIRDSRTFSLSFSYRFGKPLKSQNNRRTGGAVEEQNRIKSGGN